jgi:NADH-quinone oxidoreductase E subunit
MKVELSAGRLVRFKQIVAKYEMPQSALLPTLYLAQEQFGFISREVEEYVAGLLGLTPRHVHEVVMFYTMFRKKDLGKWCLQVCNNVTCTMMGSEDLMKVVKEELGIGHDGVTDDKKFSCVSVQCLGSCDTAPVVQVNEEYVEKLDPNRFRDILKQLKSGRTPKELEVQA